MAQTKVKLVSNGVITVDNLHTNHGITTDHIGEGSVLYYTDARVQSYLTTNNYITNADVANLETVTSLSLAANTLSYVDEAGNTTNLDLSLYLDDTNLARLVSGTLDGATGIATFTRDDATTFTVDLSSLTPSETDPVFTASAASGITSTNITNWDTAYGWGNHASAGYLTSLPSHTHVWTDITDRPTALSLFTNDAGFLTSFTETDPIYTSSSWYTTTNNSSNWNTAYGWGDHASAGYLTSFDITTQTDPKYLRSNANDTASGELTLTGKVVMSDFNTQLPGHYYHGFYSGTQNYIHLYSGGHTGAASITDIRAWNGTSAEVFRITGNSNNMTWRGHTIWNSGNDGSGSGLDADTVDGIQASRIIFGSNSSGTNDGTITDWNAPTKTGFYSDDDAANRWSGQANWTSILHFKLYDNNNNYASQIGFNTYDDGLYTRTNSGGTWTSWKKIWTEYSDGSGSGLDADLLDGLNSSAFVRTDQNAVTIQRHLDASTTWSNSALTLFLGWYGGKVVIGNNNNSQHDNANALGGNTIAVTNSLYSFVDTRSPIFYDSNNTGYYVDPASTSNLNLLTMPTIDIVNGTSYNENIRMHPGSNDYSSLILGAVAGTSGTGSGQWSLVRYPASNGNKFTLRHNSSDYIEVLTSGATTISTDTRSPIFYDSNNTGYYLNPDGFSNLHSATFNANWAGAAPHQGAINIRGNYPSMMFRNFVSNTAWLRHMDGAGDIQHYYVPDGYDSVNWSIKHTMTGSGSFYSSADHRAPIFYDSNDTGYYVDPNSSSKLNMLNIASAPAGRTLSLGTDDTSRVYDDAARSSLVINASYYPHLYLNATTFANNANHGPVISMTGVLSAGGYRRWGMGIPNTDPAALSWGVWDNNTNPHYSVGGNLGYTTTGSKMWLDTGGNLQTTGSMRSPIFYDSNNTGYYVDPTSTSNLNSLYIQGGVAGISNSAVYHEAAIEVRERGFGGSQDDTWATAPRIGMHWGGRVASQIALSSNGWINIMNNPGNGYEGFRAGAIYSTGDVTAYYSDVRLKDIQGPIENALSSVLSIETFKYKNNDIAKSFGFAGDEVQVGVSAQSIEKVLPEVVKHAPFDIESKDGKNVSKSGENYLTVQYEKIVPLLIEATKEQQTIIEDLKQQIEELKSLINK